MTTDLFATVFWQDGMEIDSASLNTAQRQVRAQVTDQLAEKLIGGVSNNFASIIGPDFSAENGSDAPTLWAYAPSVGAAYLRVGSANNKIQITPGTIFQKIANADGVDSTLVPYTFAGTEEFTVANGATEPRVDLLQMKLEYITDTSASLDFEDAVTRAKTTTSFAATRRRVKCTLSTKQGTPAPAPVIPDPDAGFVPVGMALVGLSWTSAIQPTFAGDPGGSTSALTVHDLRMPMCVRAFRVDPVLFKLETAFALSSSNQIALASSGTNKMYVGCGTGPGRIIGIGIELTSGSASFSVPPILGLLINQGASPPSTGFVNMCSLAGGGFQVNAPMVRYLRQDFEGHAQPSASSPVIQPSATNKIGTPVWTNGVHVPQDDPSGDFFGYAGVAFINQPSATQIGGVTFYIAQGL